MNKRKSEKSISDLQLSCIQNPTNPKKFECSERKKQIHPEDQITGEDITDSTSLTKKLVKHQHKNPEKQNTTLLISTITLTTLFSGFGFAFAYLILYYLYDWSTNPLFELDLVRAVISIIIILTLLVSLIFASYFTLKRAFKVVPQYPYLNQSSFVDDPANQHIPKYNR